MHGLHSRTSFTNHFFIRWIENCLQETIDPIIKLEDSMRDGVVLAKLASWFAPGIVHRIIGVILSVGRRSELEHMKDLSGLNLHFLFLSSASLLLRTPNTSFSILKTSTPSSRLCVRFDFLRPFGLN
jgi:hypothetical protein